MKTEPERARDALRHSCQGGGEEKNAQDIKNINRSVGKLVKASLLASAEKKKKFLFESGDGAPRFPACEMIAHVVS